MKPKKNQNEKWLSLEALEEHVRETEAELKSETDADLREALEVELSGSRAALTKARERRAYQRSIAGNPLNLETTHDPNMTGQRLATGDRDEALRAIERLRPSSTAGDRLVELVERDRLGVDSRYLVRASNPAYVRAFMKTLESPVDAHLRMTPEEHDALRAMNQSVSERAMALGTNAGADGGYAVPSVIDPSIMLTSDGGLNVLREVATVTTINSYEWRGVSSDGVVASFADEAAEATDDSPTLAQPVIKPERMQIFIPFSWELGQDMNALLQELGQLMSDAKDVLEADRFLNGAGTASNEPEGLIAGIDAGSVVETESVGAFDPADVYSFQESLGARFQPRASWLTSLAIGNKTHRFETGFAEPPLFNEDRTKLLGKPWREAALDSTVEQGNDIAIYGDLAAAYRVVERAGMQISLIPHLFGANRRPTGQSGLYAFARVSGGIVNDAAVRLLRVQST